MQEGKRDNLPNAQEVERFITALCSRTDVPLAGFFQEYWIRDKHLNRLSHLLHRLAQYLNPDTVLLDVGSFGEWPLLLWRYLGLHNLIACSLEGGYLAFGEGVLKSDGEPGTEFELRIEEINIETEPLPAEDESVDVVTFFEVLEHLRIDPIFTMKEINRILRPGGLLMLTTPNIGSFEGLLRILNSDTPNIFSQYFPHRKGLGHTKDTRSRRPASSVITVVSASKRLRPSIPILRSASIWLPWKNSNR